MTADPPAGIGERVLVLAPFGRDAEEVGGVLGSAGFDVEACADADTLCDKMRRGAGAAMLAEEALDDDARARIGAVLAEQPAWSDFPLLIMTSRRRDGSSSWIALRGLEGTAQLTLLQRPLSVATVVSTIRVALASRRRQYQVRDELAARRQVEAELKTLNDTLEARVAERTALAERRARDLGRLAAELSQAEQRERQRLARLLHDDLQQLLLAARLRLPMLGRGDHKDLEEGMKALDELLADCMRTSRDLTQELSPPILQRGTSAQVIQWLRAWFCEKHGLAVAADVPEGLPPLPEHLQGLLFQAVRELLFNVVKHSGQKEARVIASLEENRLTVRVDDDGDGFEPEAIEARLQNPEGFGLFNIRERLEALGGRLDIRATPRGGASFQMTILLGDRAAPPLEELAPRHAMAAPGHRRPPRAAEGAIRLLIVDDHAVVRQGFVELLDRHPVFKVVGEAADGLEAVAQADALSPDAVIMDIDMPNLDGIEATRRIKQRQADTVVIGLSLHDEEAVRNAMRQAGADACVSKHAAVNDLAELICQLSQ